MKVELIVCLTRTSVLEVLQGLGLVILWNYSYINQLMYKYGQKHSKGARESGIIFISKGTQLLSQLARFSLPLEGSMPILRK